jgi:hypothetical protein
VATPFIHNQNKRLRNQPRIAATPRSAREGATQMNQDFISISLYIFTKKILDQEKHVYNFLEFSSVLGWHAPAINTPQYRCVGFGQCQTQKMCALQQNWDLLPKL